MSFGGSSGFTLQFNTFVIFVTEYSKLQNANGTLFHEIPCSLLERDL